MPPIDRQFGHFAKLIETPELVVDQCLQRADVNRFEASPRRVGDTRDDGQKGCLSLAACGSRSDDDIGLGIENRRDGLFLNVAQLAPVLLPDPPPDRLAEAVEAGRRLVRA